MSNTKQMASLFSAEWKSASRRCVLNLGLTSCLRYKNFKKCTHFARRSRVVSRLVLLPKLHRKLYGTSSRLNVSWGNAEPVFLVVGD